MWEAIIRFVAPMALDVVRERLLVRREAPAGSTDRQGGDMESRLLALQSQVEVLHQAEAQQIDELTKVLGVIGLRATVALWLGISSVITTLAVFLFTIFKA